MILTASISSRTYESTDKLRSNVASIWGTPQVQSQPTASYDEASVNELETVVDGKKVVTHDTTHTTVPLSPESSRINVNLAVEYRQKGLLWYSVYVVNFSGVYAFRNTTAVPRLVTFQLNLPSDQAIYDGLVMELNGNTLPFTATKQAATVAAALAPGQTALFHSAYRPQGLESWRYKLGDDVTQTRNFELAMTTNFKQIDFPTGTLSPTQKQESGSGWRLTWRYRNLISGFQIGMTMPEKLQPGPLAGDISRFAPVSLLLFFFVIFIITTLRRIDLHPMNYFFLAASFFAFHLLFAYLVDHISVGAAFVVCSGVSVALVISYLRLVVGPRFAIFEAGGAQLIYLVLFSYTFFVNGFTGLAITIGCILTLFLVMQLTGHVRWSERFRSSAAPPELPRFDGTQRA